MPMNIYVQFLLEQPNSNIHFLNRLVKLLNHFISIEPKDKPRGYEDHHIVPKAKSWKPEWDKIPENHLKVPAKAHYVIHHLMWKAYPKNGAITKAFQQMCRLEQKITAKVYEVLRFDFIETISECNSERVKNDTHNFSGGELQRHRVANGTHNFLKHDFINPSQTKKTCGLGQYGRWHGDQCKFSPFLKMSKTSE